MTRNKAANCGNCPYWVASPVDHGALKALYEPEGGCHRRPPSAEGVWSPTFCSAWCGEHPSFDMCAEGVAVEALALDKEAVDEPEPPSAPTIVCLCGSTKFKEAFLDAAKSETLDGRIVLSVGFFGHADGITLSSEHKAKLDILHLRKIDLADEVLVVNVGQYIGESTQREIEYARSTGKPVRYLETCGAYSGALAAGAEEGSEDG